MPHCRQMNEETFPVPTPDLLAEPHHDSDLQFLPSMDNRKVYEEGVMRAELLRSAILKPYWEAYYRELAEGKVHKENVEKAVDFYFSDICVSFRALPNLTDEEMDREIKAAKQHLGSIKSRHICGASTRQPTPNRAQ